MVAVIIRVFHVFAAVSIKIEACSADANRAGVGDVRDAVTVVIEVLLSEVFASVAIIIG